MIRGVYLRHTSGGHNKHYFIWIDKSPVVATSYTVFTAWGGIGKTPQMKQGNTFASQHKAQQELAAIIDQRVGRGYDIRWDSATTPVEWVIWKTSATAPAREPDYGIIVHPPGFGLPANVGSNMWTKMTPSPSLPTTVVGQGSVKTKGAQKRKQPPKNKKAVTKVKEKVSFKRHDADWNF